MNLRRHLIVVVMAFVDGCSAFFHHLSMHLPSLQRQGSLPDSLRLGPRILGSAREAHLCKSKPSFCCLCLQALFWSCWVYVTALVQHLHCSVTSFNGRRWSVCFPDLDCNEYESVLKPVAPNSSLIMVVVV